MTTLLRHMEFAALMNDSWLFVIDKTIRCVYICIFFYIDFFLDSSLKSDASLRLNYYIFAFQNVLTIYLLWGNPQFYYLIILTLDH